MDFQSVPVSPTASEYQLQSGFLATRKAQLKVGTLIPGDLPGTCDSV